MSRRTTLEFRQAGPEDWRQGKHYEWECKLHEACKWYQEKKGIYWTHATKNSYLEKLYHTYSWSELHVIRECKVCIDEIRECLANGTDPFAIPDTVRQGIALVRKRYSLRKDGLVIASTAIGG